MPHPPAGRRPGGSSAPAGGQFDRIPGRATPGVEAHAWPPAVSSWPLTIPSPRPVSLPAPRSPAFDPVLRAARRKDVVARAAAEVCEDGAYRRAPVLAVRSFDDGCVVVALAGCPGRDMVERLGGLLRDLRSRAAEELVLELTAVTDPHPSLARLLGQVRIRGLIDGVRVELRNSPPDLAAALEHPI